MASEHLEGTILMVFDGYDEMGEKPLLLRCLAKLKNFTNIRIIVSTRPHHRTELEKTLRTRAYKFLAIKKKDRGKFLAQNWSQILRTNPVGLIEFAKKVISVVHLPLVKKREEFFGVPLQLKILAEMFLKPLKNYLASMSKTPEVDIQKFIEKDWTLAKVYRKYINQRLTIYLQEKLSYQGDQDQLQLVLNNTITPPLSILAGKFIFNSYDSQADGEINEWFQEAVSILHGTRNVKVIQDFIPLLLKTGLLYGNQDKPDFLHKTFAEYFISKCLADVVLLEVVSPSSQRLKDCVVKSFCLRSC